MLFEMTHLMALINWAVLSHTETPDGAQPVPNIMVAEGIRGSQGRAALTFVWVYLALKSNEFDIWLYVSQSPDLQED